MLFQSTGRRGGWRSVNVCIASFQIDPDMFANSDRIQSSSSACGSSMEIQTMVSNIIRPSNRSAMSAASGFSVSLSSLGESTTPSSQSPQPQGSHVASFWYILHMVANIIGPSDRSAMSAASGSSVSSSSLRESTAPSSQSPQPQGSHVASIRKSLCSQNIPERVSKILMASWKKRTEKEYESAWKQFCRWCH